MLQDSLVPRNTNLLIKKMRAVCHLPLLTLGPFYAQAEYHALQRQSLFLIVLLALTSAFEFSWPSYHPDYRLAHPLTHKQAH